MNACPSFERLGGKVQEADVSMGNGTVWGGNGADGEGGRGADVQRPLGAAWKAPPATTPPCISLYAPSSGGAAIAPDSWYLCDRVYSPSMRYALVLGSGELAVYEYGTEAGDSWTLHSAIVTGAPTQAHMVLSLDTQGSWSIYKYGGAGEGTLESHQFGITMEEHRGIDKRPFRLTVGDDGLVRVTNREDQVTWVSSLTPAPSSTLSPAPSSSDNPLPQVQLSIGSNEVCHVVLLRPHHATLLRPPRHHRCHRHARLALPVRPGVLAQHALRACCTPRVRSGAVRVRNGDGEQLGGCAGVGAGTPNYRPSMGIRRRPGPAVVGHVGPARFWPCHHLPRRRHYQHGFRRSDPGAVPADGNR